MATGSRMTADDLWRMGDADVRRELVEGRVIEMPPVGRLHGLVSARICRYLTEHVENAGGGEVLNGDVGFVLALPGDPDRVRAPDVAFLTAARIPQTVRTGFVPGAPDLAVEILSPSDDPVQVQQKVRDYLEAGGRLVWIVAPEARAITVYRADGSARLLRDKESVDGEDVLPGLRIPLLRIFA